VNEPTGIIDAQLQHLLEVVERNRGVRCRALLEEAREQARALVKQAYSEARTRLHRNVLSTREQARQQFASAEAQRNTRLRLQRHRMDQALLVRAWEPLSDELHRRWRLAGPRQQWIDKLLAQATATLVDPHWRIEHPKDWQPQEQSALQTRLDRDLGYPAVFAVKPEIQAGLRICAGKTCVDGTVDGLLRARTRIEALMLATLNECRSRMAADE
jgi:hypothetical protein